MSRNAILCPCAPFNFSLPRLFFDTVDEHLIVSEESRKSLQQASKSNTIKSLEVAKTNVDRNAISSSVTRTEGASSTTTPFKTSPKLTELENVSALLFAAQLLNSLCARWDRGTASYKTTLTVTHCRFMK